jgi:surface antigen
MRPVKLIATLIALSLGACAGLRGADAALYDRLDQGDVALAADALQDALESAPDGTTRSWVNGQTGHRGAITPTRTYLAANGHFCRDYREELTIGEEAGRFYHTACRDDAERWVWL